MTEPACAVTPRTGDIVLVEWEDALLVAKPCGWGESYSGPVEPSVNRSVGILRRKTADAVLVDPHRLFHPSCGGRSSGEVLIPTRSIRAMFVLRPVGEDGAVLPGDAEELARGAGDACDLDPDGPSPQPRRPAGDDAADSAIERAQAIGRSLPKR